MNASFPGLMVISQVREAIAGREQQLGRSNKEKMSMIRTTWHRVRSLMVETHCDGEVDVSTHGSQMRSIMSCSHRVVAGAA